jgi:hypothetical protein
VSQQALKPDPSQQEVAGHMDGVMVEARPRRPGFERMVDVRRHENPFHWKRTVGIVLSIRNTTAGYNLGISLAPRYGDVDLLDGTKRRYCAS